VQGYWDHDIVHRGVMFAPVYYDRPIYARPDYYYSPNTVIDLAMMAACLFVQPGSHHYYYGDYYDHRYEERGFYPWWSKQIPRYGDDPNYAHYRSSQLTQDPDWDVHVDEQYRHRREHVEDRPPQTLALQMERINTKRDAAHEEVIIGRSIGEAVQSKTLPLRFTSINMDERKKIETNARDVRKFQMERAKMETAPAVAGKPEKRVENAQPVKLRMRASPVFAKPLEKRSVPSPVLDASKSEAVGGGTEKTPKVELKTPSPRLPEKDRIAPAPVTTKQEQKTQKTEATRSPAKEKPGRVKSRPEMIGPPQTQKNLAPKPESVKQERVQVKTESKSKEPQAAETAKPKKVEARPQTETKAPQNKNNQRAVNSTSEQPKSETPTPEVRKQKVEPQVRQDKSEAKGQKIKRKQPSAAESNKDDKR
jgi:hypothetical protein